MSDEPAKKSLRAFASELTAAMKKNSKQPTTFDDDAEEPEAGVPPEREALLRVLESDVDACGWDQPAKLWGVLEDPDSGEEYLKLITTLKNHAPSDIEKMAKKGRAKDDVKGVVVAVEAWAYPQSLMQALDGDGAALNAFYRVIPPSDYPERTERRAVTMFNRDGSFACISRMRGGEPDMIPAVDPELIPAVARLLGMKNEHQRKQGTFAGGMDADEMIKAIDQMSEVLKFIVRAQAGAHQAMTQDGVSQEQYLRGVFESLPEETRQDLLKSMPEELKKMLGF